MDKKAIKFLKLVLIIIVSSCGSEKTSNLKLMDIFSNGMVLQQKTTTKIWGISNPNQVIKIESSWGKISSTKSDLNGNWISEIETPNAGGPYSLEISDGIKTKKISDILIGEVWFASGQSNMEMPLQGYLPAEPIDNADEEILNSLNNNIRMFTVTNNVTLSKIDTADGEWLKSSPKNSRYFSATAYFFAKKLQKELNIPIGIISSSWGGTPAESWVSEEKLRTLKEFEDEINELHVRYDKFQNKSVPLRENKGNVKDADPNDCCLNLPVVLYNSMVHPFINYKIAGSIWYQGESNVPKPQQYHELFSLMINDWRDKWGFDFPFYFVQLAPHKYSGQSKNKLAELRDAQRLTLKLPKTGMAVTLDNTKNFHLIHPTNKKSVGLRLAYIALNRTYNKDFVDSGPLYKSILINKNKIIIEFDHVEGGLTKKEDELTGFEIAGENKKFIEADAKIKDNKVVVWNKKISNPKYVRYAWKDTSTASLFNKHGLPASSFNSIN
tara:strand:+ start:6337 stop:7827 length:1491 start_codon:yes stop_codon:yes gene_type:complete